MMDFLASPPCLSRFRGIGLVISLVGLASLPACGGGTIQSGSGTGANAVTGNTGGLSGGTPNAGVSGGTVASATSQIYFAGLPKGTQQFTTLCGTPRADAFFTWYCAAATPPKLTGVTDVLTGLKMYSGTDLASTTQFTVVSQTASLDAREITELNPEAIIYNDAAPFVAVAFARGSDMLEVAAHDPNTQDINFYLVHFQLPCDASNSCTTLQRFLPQNESGWVSADVYDGHLDLKNTVLNCDVCHRPTGFDFSSMQGKVAVLRMQELLDPWTHWFRSDRGSAMLLTDFCTAHSTDPSYAGIPIQRVCTTPEKQLGDPAILETNMVQAFNYELEPNVLIYDGQEINNDDPTFQGPPSAAWLSLYNDAVAGLSLSPPYFAINPFDSSKLAAASKGYQAAAQGGQTPFPDLANLFQDAALPYLGQQAVTEVNGQPATATQIVQHRCTMCHSGAFQNSGNRDNFNVADFPNNLTPDMVAKIKARVSEPANSVLLMPPATVADLNSAQIQLIINAMP